MYIGETICICTIYIDWYSRTERTSFAKLYLLSTERGFDKKNVGS